MSELTLDAARAQLEEVFAPWVKALGLRLEELSEQRVLMRLPYSDDLCRAGQVVCGQAMMTLIDTCSVFVCWGALGELRDVTTVQQSSSFLRPVIGRDVLAEGRPLKAGRTLVFTDITLRADGDDRPAAHGSSTFAVLPGSLAPKPG